MQLRKLLEKDLPGMLEWMQDPAVLAGLRMGPERRTEAAARAFIKAAQQQDALHLACVDEMDAYLGTVSMKNIDPENRSAELAIVFRRAAHGTGAAAYAMQEMERIAFEERKLHRLYLYVLRENERAVAFYEKLGFCREGLLRDQLLIDGRYRDQYLYRMLKEEYDAHRT